jgi:hypothetical protein
MKARPAQEKTKSMDENPIQAKRDALPRRMSVRPAFLLAAAALTGAVVLAGCGDSSTKANSDAKTTRTNAFAVTPEDLRSLAVRMRQPIYWVGAGTNVTYERARTVNGRIVLRYLPEGAELGTRKLYLTVGTYKLSDAYAATQFAASKAGAVRLEAPSGAIAFSTRARPLNAWITYPGSRYQIEVFDPTPGRARSLVASGRVARVPGSPRESTSPVAVSPKRLAELAATAKLPIYWAGPVRQRTYELTRTSQGGFLVRYLPQGTGIGAPAPRLTIGTYPVKDAFAAVKQLSLTKGASVIKLSRGGLAVINPRFPKSVYLAYPGLHYEVEVFDPSLAGARRLVTSGQITTVQ